MDYRYVPGPDDRNGRLFHLGCELNEASHAIHMIQRFGAHSKNPLKDGDHITNPSNVAHLLLELWDVEYAARASMADIVAFLGDETMVELRAAWEAKAHPPVYTPVETPCPSCGGSGVVQAITGDEGNCGKCGGLGSVR